MHRFSRLLAVVAICVTANVAIAQSPALFDLNTGLQSRAITAENTTGAPGEGGKAASELGVGRKGSPRYKIKVGETYQLCDIEGTGTIRHIWMTGDFRKDTALMRSMVLRVYWDGQEHPSIECPLGDFMGGAHGLATPYQSAVHSIGELGSLNFWIPMPFKKGARFTLTNAGKKDCMVYYQLDYTIGDEHPDDVGRLHVQFRRENPTTLKEDFVLMPQRKGKGRFLGAVMGIRTLHPGWWGEGEMKAYMDGDNEFPTICGTGAEDYVGLSYGIQKTTHQYHGCSLLRESKKKFKMEDLKENKTVEAPYQYISMYRWHLLDPIYWNESCRITIQQIGCCYYERDDDWSTASFWYEPVPSAPLEPLPSVQQRTADLQHLPR